MRVERDSNMTSAAVAGMPAHRVQSKYDRLIAKAKEVPAAKRSSSILAMRLRFAVRSRRQNPASSVPILVGPAAKINNVAREHELDIGKFELVDVAHSEAAASKAVELIRAGQGRIVDERQPAYRRADAGCDCRANRPAYGAADQPRLHHGRADLCRNVVHHRRRDQHFPRSRCQARHRSECHRSVHPCWARHAARRDSLRGRNGHVQDSVDHRCGCALQDGRPRADHRRHP